MYLTPTTLDIIDENEIIDLIPALGKKCQSGKEPKKLAKTPEQFATDRNFKKKRHEKVVKARRSNKIYREYTMWK